jgi:hypothetical protein
LHATFVVCPYIHGLYGSVTGVLYFDLSEALWRGRQ